MRILTWNINSVRLRMPLLEAVVESASPDIICLQETKVTDDLFPRAEIEALGYPYLHFRGMKGYNGVAILSRLPIMNTGGLDFVEKQDMRHISIELEDGTEIHNFYIPAGGDEPDIEINDKFAHKLAFIKEVQAWFATHRSPDHKMILVGDLNIAPLEHDVWSHKQLLKVVSHTPIEVSHLNAMQDSVSFKDALRKFVPETEKLYTWWSYRGKDWDISNRGRRLDHIWATDALFEKAVAMKVMKEFRGMERPSDHVPTWVDFNLV